MTAAPSTPVAGAVPGPAPTGPAVTGTMRAVVRDRYGEPAQVVRLGRVALPEIGSDELLVRVRAAGVDRGVVHLVTGLPYPVRLAGFGVRAPKDSVIGGDLAGTVVAVGAGVTRFGVGDEVYGTGHGSFADHVRARERTLAPKPASLGFEQAAAMPVSATTALQAVRDHGRVRPGQHVLVLGASGGVGSFAVQIARASGAAVTGVARTAKLDFVRSLGADAVLDHTADALPDGRFDVIVDAGGNTRIALLRRALTRTGTLVVVGGETGGRVLGGVQRQLGATLLSPLLRQRLGTFVCKPKAADLAVLSGLVDSGQVTPPVDRVLPLEQAVTALELLVQGSVRGKLVLSVLPPGGGS